MEAAFECCVTRPNFLLTNRLFCVKIREMGYILFTIVGLYLGAGIGNYSPALSDYRLHLREDRLKQNIIYRLNVRSEFPFAHFPISAEVAYFTTESYSKDYSLLLVPISVLVSAVSEFVPVLIWGEVGIGYERVYARFAKGDENASGWGNGLLLIAGVNIALPKGLMFDIVIRAKDGGVRDMGNRIFRTDENLDLIFSDTYISFGIRYRIIGRR